MAESWRSLARQLRDFPTYLARLRNHELPTLIVSAIDNQALLRSQGRLTTKEDDKEVEEIVQILLQIIANKWPFATDVSVSAEHQRILDYAHDWACETLLSLEVPDAGERPTPPAEARALDEMERALFSFHAHTPSDRLAHVEASVHDALQCHRNLRPEQATRLLESCVTAVEDDASCIKLLEMIAAPIPGKPIVFSPVKPDCMARHLARPAPSNERLFDELSLTARVALWASDVALWINQLDDWLVEVHEIPFADVKTMVCGHRNPGPSVACPSHLYDTLVAWIMQPTRRKWLCSVRSRLLVHEASCLTRNGEFDHTAFSRRLFAKVPVALLQKSNGWTPHQRSFALTAIARTLPADEPRSQDVWYEFVGLVERIEIVHVAMSAVIAGTADASFHPSTDIIAWYYSVFCPSGPGSQREVLRTAIQETVLGFGGEKSLADGVAWLKLHRSSAYASFTLTRLRLTWRWVLVVVSQSQDTRSALSESLDSLEYVIRRYAPVEDSRRFQIEAVSTLLEDLDWVFTQRDWSGDSEKRRADAVILLEWIKKLVKLVPPDSSLPEPQHLSQQLTQRLQLIKL